MKEAPDTQQQKKQTQKTTLKGWMEQMIENSSWFLDFKCEMFSSK